ncbi:unnamed protein product [Rotaria sp. Silwood2]|nr:unnamed protein product [Rotaria sp. Silwood2]
MYLYLHYNEIGEEGAKSLSQLLEKNGTLLELNLCGNSIGDKGAQYLAQALEKNETLTKMDLGSNGISDEGAKHIAKCLQNNKVTHSSSHQLYDESLRYIIQALESMGLYINEISAETIEEIKEILKTNEKLTITW